MIYIIDKIITFMFEYSKIWESKIIEEMETIRQYELIDQLEDSIKLDKGEY